MLEIQKEDAAGVQVVRIKGPVDSATFDEFKRALMDATKGSASKVLLDCADLTYMNSKAFGLLAQYHRICLQSLGQLALCALNRKIVKTMDLLGLGQMLKIYETRVDALAEMK